MEFIGDDINTYYSILYFRRYLSVHKYITGRFEETIIVIILFHLRIIILVFFLREYFYYYQRFVLFPANSFIYKVNIRRRLKIYDIFLLIINFNSNRIENIM